MATTVNSENLRNGYGLADMDYGREAVKRFAGHEAAHRARKAKIGKRVVGLSVATGLVAAGAVADHLISASGAGSQEKQPAPAVTTVNMPEQLSTPQTTIVKVEKQGAGIYSTVDDLVEKGQIEPDHEAEYKQKALEMHNNDPNVLLGEGIPVPVDSQTPTTKPSK